MTLAMLREAVELVPQVYDHLTPRAQVLLGAKAAGDLAAITAQYRARIAAALTEFFETGKLRQSLNAFKRATVMGFTGAFELGWKDGGAKEDYGGEENNWLITRTEAEFGWIGMLYQQAKELKDEPEFDPAAWTEEKAEGYSRTLRDVYNAGLLRAMKGKMLTFDGQDGSPEHVCQKTGGTCVRLKGQRHRASWWVKHDLFPYQGNANMDCGGWGCQHFLRDDKGKQITL